MPDEQTVPFSRFKEKTDQNALYKSQIEDLKSQIEALQPQATRATELEQKLSDEIAAHKTTKSASADALAFVGAGITDAESQELVRFRLGRLGDDAPSLADYLLGAAREDRFLSSVFAADAPKTEAPKPPAAAVPQPGAEMKVEDPPDTVVRGNERVFKPHENAGVVTPPDPTGNRLKEISDMSPEEYASNRGSLLAEFNYPA